MDKIRFFDASVRLGARMICDPGSFYETPELIRKMEYYGIERALAYHSLASNYNAKIGNDILTDEIKNSKIFSPVWVVMPNHTGEFYDPDELRVKMRENDVRAVKILPRDHNYSLSEWNSGELLKMLEDCRVPVMIGQNQTAPDIMHDVMLAHPELRMILTDIHYSGMRNLYPLLKKFKGLYIETIMFKTLEGIEDICGKFGAERLIFGSGAPHYSGGAAMAMINYASVSDDEKNMIASGNLEKLLGEASL